MVDLNVGKWAAVEVYDAGLRPLQLRFSQQVLNSDYRIAIGPPKTHDVVGVTISIKNLAMGALDDAGGNKRLMHQGYPVHNLNLYLLAKVCPLQLAVIDGYIGMEGEGPVSGTAVSWRVAVAGCDPVAVDSLTAQLMRFDIDDIGYLTYCQKKGLGVIDVKEMNIVGANPKDCYLKFKPHSTFAEQRNWRDERVSKLLGI